MTKQTAADRPPAAKPVKLVGVRLPVRTAAMLRTWAVLNAVTQASTADACLRGHLEALLETKPAAFRRAFRAAVDAAAAAAEADADEGLDGGGG